MGAIRSMELSQGTLEGAVNIPILQMEELRLKNMDTHLERDRVSRKPVTTSSVACPKGRKPRFQNINSWAVWGHAWEFCETVYLLRSVLDRWLFSRSFWDCPHWWNSLLLGTLSLGSPVNVSWVPMWGWWPHTLPTPHLHQRQLRSCCPPYDRAHALDPPRD